MNTFVALIVAGLMIMVVVSLVRGIAAFLQSTRVDLERDDKSGPSEMQLRQSKMMFNRIMFQGAAVLIVAILLASHGK